jgi:hypothetical protein
MFMLELIRRPETRVYETEMHLVLKAKSCLSRSTKARKL